MPVNTDAKIPATLSKVNLINTGGTSSNNQVLRVKINGRSHFVQVRLNADGGYAAVAVQRNEIEKQVPKSRLNPEGVEKTKVDRPWVIFTVDRDGKRTYGGKGRTHTPTDPGFLGNLTGEILPFFPTKSSGSYSIFTISREPASISLRQNSVGSIANPRAPSGKQDETPIRFFGTEKRSSQSPIPLQ